ncbi:putative prophage terminase, small subunit [Escherichia coli]|uniref:Putative prophage terminase, small subunit n=1 Tax=Escherichia coli TaxID=562 RepID=A0A376KNC9_ECOLX|nr:putative prophage terminase, small subunit [Escherichia coli]
MSGPPENPATPAFDTRQPLKAPPLKTPKKPLKRMKKGVPKTPRHLGAQGKYWFRRMAEELNAEGIISQLDARALELLVEAYTEYRHHCETLDVEGYTYRTETQKWRCDDQGTSGCGDEGGCLEADPGNACRVWYVTGKPGESKYRRTG